MSDFKKKDQIVELRRTLGMAAIVVIAIGLFCVLVFAGVSTDTSKSTPDNYFKKRDRVFIECLGDSITEGYTIADGEKMPRISATTYPEELGVRLNQLLSGYSDEYKCSEVTVDNFGQSGSIITKNSYLRLSGNAEIVIILYSVNNFIEGIEYEGTLEANINAVQEQGGMVFLMNYPIMEGSPYEDKLLNANKYISDTAQRLNVQLIDMYQYFKDLDSDTMDEMFISDGIHLTEKGYTAIGDQAALIIHDYYQN